MHYKEKYLREKEKSLELHDAYLQLAHSHQCQTQRIK